MKQLIRNLVIVAIAIYGVTLVSCNDDETIPAVVAGFVFTIDQETGEVTFENTSENATTYAWDFGDGATSTLENPSHTFEPGQYTVELTASNANGDSDTFSDDVTIDDTTAPVITLVGDAPLCLMVGDSYSDPGATATDDVDGDLTSSIIVGGDVVDTSTPGIYEVTYNVSDSEGNAATEVTRGVVVNELFEVEGNLVSNGDFNDGATGWVGNGGAPDIRDEGCDPYYFANPTVAGNSFDINVAQVIELETGATYTLTFEASSDGERTIIAGIGQNFGDFLSANETVNLTSTPTEFVLDGLIPNFPAGTDSRVYFDLGADVGVVVLDDISVVKTADPAPAGTPATAAPTPTRAEADVISIFSDAYTDVTVDTWRTEWSSATYEEVMIQGNATKKYSALDFVGVETVVNKVDASNMTHIHVDVWSEDFTQFSLKLVDFAATGNTEHQVDYMNPTQGEWISYDIPLSSFTGLANRADIAQYIFVGRPIGANTIYLDNIYFYFDENAGGGGGTPGENLATNGDFEAGDVSGWQSFPTATSTFTAVTTNPADGTHAGRILNEDLAAGAVVKQANLGIGTVAVGDQISISFDIRGTLEAGGVVNIEFFEEVTPEGVSRSELLGGGPIVTLSPDTWETKTYTTTVTTDVSNGITLQIGAATGGATGSKADVYIDNVVIAILE